jgi:hypothetical protein
LEVALDPEEERTVADVGQSREQQVFCFVASLLMVLQLVEEGLGF